MRRLRAFVLRLRGFLGGTAFERDLSDELESHLELQIEDNVRAGMTLAEARRDALVRLGAVEAAKEAWRERRTVPWLEHVFQDVRYAGRLMRIHPGFTLVAVLTLACGIGGITAIFTTLNAVLLKPLPVREPHELFVVYETAPEEVAEVGGPPGRLIRFSYPRFERLEKALAGDGTLAAMSRATRLTLRLSRAGVVGTAQGQLVSGRYFQTFDVPAVYGRLITNADTDAASASPIAVISHRLWQSRLGGTPDVVGREVIVNEVPIVIVGIAPPTFTGVWLETPIDIWLPLPMQHAVRYRGNASFHNSDGDQPWLPQAGIEWLNIVGRTARERLAGVRASLDAGNQAGLRELAEIVGDAEWGKRRLAHTLEIGSFARGFSGLRDQSGRTLSMLTALAALVLLVVCSNVANLLLARAIGRQREIAVRMSLGATRGRLIGQCLIESLVLAAAGGALGLMMAGWTSALLAGTVLNVSSDVLSRAFAFDLRVIGFAALVSGGTAVVFGLVPALRVSHVEPHGSIGAGTRTSAAGGSVAGMQTLVATQLALSFVVVATAGLFGRSLVNLSRFNPGFDREHLVTIAMDPVVSGYTAEQIRPLSWRLRDAVTTVPGVISAVVSDCGLISGCENASGHQFEGYQPAPGEPVRARDNFVGPGYFSTVGMPLVAGREIDERDRSNTPLVAVVNESVVQRYFGGESPIGRRLGYGTLDTEIVGVVRDARVTGLRQAPVPMVYRAIDQYMTPSPEGPSTRVPRALDVRVAGDPQSSVAAMRDAVLRLEPRLLVTRVAAMDQFLDGSMARDRGVAYLIAAFGILALFLACIGLYGVMSFGIALRTRELGVRLAVGATPGDLIRLLVGGALRIVVAGIAVGAIVTLAAGRLVEALLFDTSATDPATYATAVAALAAAMLVASYLPARRATRLDPAAVLRYE